MGGRGSHSHFGGGGGAGGGAQYNVFQPEAFSDARKQNALNFTDKDLADQELRPELDAIWDQLSDYSKYALWQYTAGSDDFNQPLSGFEGSWANFVGEGKVPLNNGNSPGMLSGEFERITGSADVDYEKAIYALTEGISKSLLHTDMYFYRGSNIYGLAGMLRNSVGYDKVEDLLLTGTESDVRNALIGQPAENHAFTSTSISSSTGFGGLIHYTIYAPKGTQGIYSEPQSAFGHTVKWKPKLYHTGDSYTSVGNEAEFLLQRGTKFRITDVKRNSSGIGWDVSMEVVEQPLFKNYKERTHK